MRLLALLTTLLLLVNLNTATPQESRTLPGFGPSLARKIIAFRAKRGGFKRIEELLAVMRTSAGSTPTIWDWVA